MELKRRRLFSCVVISGILASNISLAGASVSGSNDVFGLPRSAAPETAGAKTETVGSLPYSTQWISEQIGTYVYASYNTAALASQTLTIGDFKADFGSSGYAFPTVDLFARLFALAGPESASFVRGFSVWGRYSLGFASRSATLNNLKGTLDSSVEKDSLLVFSSRVGALVGYESIDWVRPYFGMEVTPYFFRNTSDLSGAEQQGGAFLFGPVLGAHFPVFFSGRASLHAEYRRTMAIKDAGQLFGSSDNYSAGLGLTF